MPAKHKSKPAPAEEEEEEDITIDDAPTSIDPYAVLSLAKDATQDQIKSAYRKAALKNHPDKAPPDQKEAANSRFQEIAFAYAILFDERRRRRYDTTGRTEESIDLEDDDFDWHTFYREQFSNVVTTEAIENFAQEYKGSEEERGHVLDAYTACNGDMNSIYSRIMLSEVLEDEERFRRMIDAAIESGEVEAYKKYTHETEKSKKSRMERARKEKEREAKELEKAEQDDEDEDEDAGVPKPTKGKSKAKASGGMGDLAALIQQRQQSRAENFFDSLEEKYAPKGRKGTKRSSEPPEEAFAKNREAGKSKKAKR